MPRPGVSRNPRYAGQSVYKAAQRISRVRPYPRWDTMRQEDRGVADTFLEGLCMFKMLIWILFSISMVMFLLSLISYTVVEPGTATYSIVNMNLIALSVILVLSGIVLYLCRN